MGIFNIQVTFMAVAVTNSSGVIFREVLDRSKFCFGCHKQMKSDKLFVFCIFFVIPRGVPESVIMQ